MKLGARIKPRVSGPRGRPEWYSSDQRLLAEIRDLLIEIEYGQRQLGAIYASIHDLAGQIAGERKAIDTLTAVADKLTTVVEGASDMVALRRWVERHGVYKELEEEVAP
jgi:hypothetical protein